MEAYFYPSVPDRIKAAVVDGLVVSVLLLAAGLVFQWIGPTFQFVAALLVPAVLVYEPTMLRLRGQTIGHGVMGIAVVKASDGARLGFWAGALRFLTKATFGWLSLLLIFATPQRRALHDLVSGSLVVDDEFLSETPTGPARTLDAR